MSVSFPNVLPFHVRLAELWQKRKKNGELTPAEARELNICLDAHLNYMWKRSQLENLSLMAYEANDMDWLHEICAELDRIHETK